MLSIISLNTSAGSKITVHAGKVAIVSIIIALVAGFFTYNLLGGPRTFLQTTSYAGYIVSGVTLLFLVDTIRYALLFYKKSKTPAFQYDSAFAIFLPKSIYGHIRSYLPLHEQAQLALLSKKFHVANLSTDSLVFSIYKKRKFPGLTSVITHASSLKKMGLILKRHAYQDLRYSPFFMAQRETFLQTKLFEIKEGDVESFIRKNVNTLPTIFRVRRTKDTKQMIIIMYSLFIPKEALCPWENRDNWNDHVWHDYCIIKFDSKNVPDILDYRRERVDTAEGIIYIDINDAQKPFEKRRGFLQRMQVPFLPSGKLKYLKGERFRWAFHPCLSFQNMEDNPDQRSLFEQFFQGKLVGLYTKEWSLKNAPFYVLGSPEHDENSRCFTDIPVRLGIHQPQDFYLYFEETNRSHFIDAQQGILRKDEFVPKQLIVVRESHHKKTNGSPAYAKL